MAAERDRPEVHGAGELAEFDDAAPEYRREAWNGIEALREARDYKPGWSLFRFEERFGVKPYDLLTGYGDRAADQPVVLDGEMLDTRTATQDLKRRVYERLAEVCAAKGYKPGWASWRYKTAFGVWPTGFVGRTRAAARVGALLRGEAPAAPGAETGLPGAGYQGEPEDEGSPF